MDQCLFDKLFAAADPEQLITWQFSIDEIENGLPAARPDPAYTQVAVTRLLGAPGQRTAFVGRAGEGWQ